MASFVSGQTKSGAVIGYPSRQDGGTVSRKEQFPQSRSRLAKPSFRNCAVKNDFSWQLKYFLRSCIEENEKTISDESENNEKKTVHWSFPFSARKKKQAQRFFFFWCLLSHKNILYWPCSCSVQMVGYWSCSISACLWPKKELHSANIQPSWRHNIGQ